MIADRTANNIILKVELRDDAGQPITGVLFSDVNLTLELWANESTAWGLRTLVDGTLGTYLSDSWKEIGEGLYEYGFPNSFIQPGQRVDLRLKYSTNAPQFDSISFLTSDSAKKVDFTISAPGIEITLDSEVLVYTKEEGIIVVFIADENIEAIPLKIIFETSDKVDVVVIPNESITKVGTEASVTLPSSLTVSAQQLSWSVRHATSERVYGTGTLSIVYAPEEDI